MLTLLVDGDMIVFEICSAIEVPTCWPCEDGEPGDLWTLHADAAEAKAKVDDRVQSLVERVLRKVKHKGDYEIVLCFTDETNFRKRILPTYKANRAGKRKPVCYYGVREWIKQNYKAYQRPGLEADDCMGILMTSAKNKTILLSGDKDFKSVPGMFYDFKKDVLHETTVEEANYWHLYQTLIGDVADNYKGCPGVGPVAAEKILAKGATWDVVLGVFTSRGLSEVEALTQARVARILRKEDYDFNKKEPILWTPRTEKK
ncbi:hypothetical protein [Anaeroselena agilis]|uniref:5'-3' exonuclease n=1 Tax=Anaeroselena agilis TaxID=3063788 RepID=A0ABU3NUY9_9FIRM|nr:hypothetical protein [Selenomonadales bacterium 4137-cl]